ncbi:hypothetical protein ACFE04_031315 [Oxalis oulophora]
MEQEEYFKEEIDWSYIEFVDNQDKPGGIISLLDEAWYAALLTPPHVNDNNMFPKSTHETFAQKMYQTFQNHKRFTKPKLSHTDFAIQHYAGEVIINLGHQGKDQTTLQMNIVQD